MRDDPDPERGPLPSGLPGGGGLLEDDAAWADALAGGFDGDGGDSKPDHRVPTREQVLERDDPLPVEPQVVPAPYVAPTFNPFGLTEQELIFCHAYAAWENGAQAAAHAKFPGGASTASKLLSDSRIRGEVTRIMAKSMRLPSEEKPANAGELIQLLNNIAFADPLELFVRGNDGRVRYKRMEDIPRELRAAIKSVALKDGEIIVTLMDRSAAITALARYHGLGTGTLPGSAKTVAEATADEEEANNAAKGEMTPVPSIPVTHENVVKWNGPRIAERVLAGTKS